MAFQYSLQRVLELIERKEQEVDAKVMAAAARRDQEVAKLAEIEFRRVSAQKGLNAQMAQGATSDVAAHHDYIQFLGQKMGAQQRSLQEAEQSLKAIQSVQEAVRRERKKLEKHREMKRAEWQEQERRKEARRIDEMAGTIFMKRRLVLEEENRELAERLEKMEKLRLLKLLRERREREHR
ncbi:MAG: flagellar export protein FliJ [Candidatus Sericytochromatia bacterium]|nr:flagellar export protein FliJ [Candidatus Sericytochromatia bacterium]